LLDVEELQTITAVVRINGLILKRHVCQKKTMSGREEGGRGVKESDEIAEDVLRFIVFHCVLYIQKKRQKSEDSILSSRPALSSMTMIRDFWSTWRDPRRSSCGGLRTFSRSSHLEATYCRMAELSSTGNFLQNVRMDSALYIYEREGRVTKQ
jgi:hypothetical protein